MMASACQKPMPGDQIKVYYELLNDIPENVLRHAVMRALAESEQNFIPAIGLLRRLASEAMIQAMPSWGAEWERINLAIRKFGHNQKQKAFVFLGPFTSAVVQQIGWDTICQSETIGVQMSQFRNLYEVAVQAETVNRRIGEELRSASGDDGRPLVIEQSKRLAVNK